MKLIANGCSWTYGGGLDAGITRQELNQLTWPKHLHDLLGISDFVNLADGCGSNQRIFRTTLDYLLNNDCSDSVFVIQFTEESRFEYYYPLSLSDQYENISERWMKAKVNVLIPSTIDRFEKHYNLSQERILYHNSEIQNVYTYIERCEALNNLFNKFNIKYYFWDCNQLPQRMPEPYRSFILNSYNWLEYNNSNWQYWEYDRINQDFDNHPSVSGHKQIAQHIYNIIKEDLQ